METHGDTLQRTAEGKYKNCSPVLRPTILQHRLASVPAAAALLLPAERGGDPAPEPRAPTSCRARMPVNVLLLSSCGAAAEVGSPPSGERANLSPGRIRDPFEDRVLTRCHRCK